MPRTSHRIEDPAQQASIDTRHTHQHQTHRENNDPVKYRGGPSGLIEGLWISQSDDKLRYSMGRDHVLRSSVRFSSEWTDGLGRHRSRREGRHTVKVLLPRGCSIRRRLQPYPTIFPSCPPLPPPSFPNPLSPLPPTSTNQSCRAEQLVTTNDHHPDQARKRWQLNISLALRAPEIPNQYPYRPTVAFPYNKRPTRF